MCPQSSCPFCSNATGQEHALTIIQLRVPSFFLTSFFLLHFQGCEDPGTPAFGSRSGTFEHGDVLTFECFEGFTLIGESTLTCNNGQYNDDAPVCKVRCDPLSDQSDCPGGVPCNAEGFCEIDRCGPQPELPSCSIEFCTSFGPDFASDFCQGNKRKDRGVATGTY
eukprot:XP_011673754.1 PREDICTED: apolipoprotein R-like isoform X2 [Strongylocentrotus purpuratus]